MSSFPPRLKIMSTIAKKIFLKKLSFFGTALFYKKTLKFVSNILPTIISGKRFLLLTWPRPLQTRFA